MWGEGVLGTSICEGTPFACSLTNPQPIFLHNSRMLSCCSCYLFPCQKEGSFSLGKKILPLIMAFLLPGLYLSFHIKVKDFLGSTLSFPIPSLSLIMAIGERNWDVKIMSSLKRESYKRNNSPSFELDTNDSALQSCPIFITGNRKLITGYFGLSKSLLF